MTSNRTKHVIVENKLNKLSRRFEATSAKFQDSQKFSIMNYLITGN